MFFFCHCVKFMYTKHNYSPLSFFKLNNYSFNDLSALFAFIIQ